MNRYYLRKLYALTLTALLLSACGSLGGVSATPTLNPTYTPLPTLTPYPTYTPVTVATATTIPTTTPLTPQARTIDENFETSLGNRWTVDTKSQARISTALAHSGKQSLEFAYMTDEWIPRATLRFEPLQACVTEFWVYIADQGLKFKGEIVGGVYNPTEGYSWDDMGFSWNLLGKTNWHNGPVFVELGRHDESISARTLKSPTPPQIDVPAKRNCDKCWVMWTLTQKYPVQQWFKVRMIVHVNRNIEFFIGDKYAGTVPGDPSEPINGIEFGGGLSLQAMKYKVYLDDVQVFSLQE